MAASYLIKVVEETFSHTRDAFMKIVFMIAKGYYQYRSGAKESGRKLVLEGIAIYDSLGYEDVASYYRKEFQSIIEA